ncbi:MAG: glycerol-3-phosphate dehydrogenase [Clostridiales bacterium]|nr:glycerol-3-phosphate dehydrogenase [Clostridiales bacterium]
MAVITIVGAGMMGSAIGIPASDNGHEVRIVGTPLDRAIIDHARAASRHLSMRRDLPASYRYYQFEQLSEALDGAEALVSGVSSFGVDWFLESVLPVVPDALPVLAVTKGMVDGADGELIPYPIYYKRRLGERALNLNAVGGPCTSYELADRDQTYVAFCGEDVGTLRRIKSLFQTSYYHISLSTDVVGVECAVAMKNAYALAVTLAVGLAERQDGKLHYNSQAALFAQSVREMRKLLGLVGGGDDNIVYGAGDLYVTVFGGRTRLIGTLLGKGLSFGEAMRELEGVTLESVVIATRTARAVRRRIELGEVSADDFPLLLHIDDILNHEAPVDIPWKKFETEF